MCEPKPPADSKFSKIIFLMKPASKKTAQKEDAIITERLRAEVNTIHS
jgi:hypothetical protein